MFVPGKQPFQPRLMFASKAGPYPRSGTNVIKLFTAVSYKFSKEARAFVPGKQPFQPRLKFVSKAGAYPRSGTMLLNFL